MTALLFGVFAVVLLIGVPVGFAISLSSISVLVAKDVNLLIVVQRMFASIDSFPLIAVPFFIFSGDLLARGAISKRLVEFAEAALGRIRGGLMPVTVGAAMFFSAISGSGAATTAAVGTTLIPELKARGYNEESSAALVAASGTIGVVIPPSVPMVLYAVIADQSVIQLFRNGFLPGIMMGGILIATSLVQAYRYNYPQGTKFSLLNLWKTFTKAIWGILMPVIILGGIFSGFINPSEGGAIGAFGAFVIMLIRRRATVAGVVGALKDSMKTTAMIFMIMVGANIFGTFLAMTALPKVIASALSTLGSEYAILWVIIIIWLILGMFIDTLPLIIILTPIFWPVVELMQWNPYWFGIIMVMCMLIGLITPPVGMSVYVIAGISKTPIMTVFKGSIPFIICLVIALIILVYIPSLSTWLPSVTAAM